MLSARRWKIKFPRQLLVRFDFNNDICFDFDFPFIEQTENGNNFYSYVRGQGLNETSCKLPLKNVKHLK